ncbi:MAG TPA: hypothetical protein VKM54_08390 [Myxococcota bacterium]|nr:hypothetical protein [Myxococcota bacterium]
MNLRGEPAFVAASGSHVSDGTRRGVGFYADAIDDRNPLWSEVTLRSSTTTRGLRHLH